MPSNFNLEHWLTLSFIDGVGIRTLHNLLRVFESPGAILSASANELKAYLPSRMADSIRSARRCQRVSTALRWAEAENCHILTMVDSRYPALLLNTTDAPPMLYACGNLSLLNQPTMIAIVGSRSASIVGVHNTKLFAQALSVAGAVVISGLAQGIDAAAHRGALEGSGGTIAVIGTGIDMTYPKINRQLSTDIAKRGLLLSEFSLGTKPLASHFPRRNRIISGMAHACLVVEATLKSGSLITARLAAEQGRDVFAVPGSINSPLHRGCHQLIKQGAKLAENFHDILEELGSPLMAAVEASSDTATPAAEAVATATNDESLLSYIDYEPTSVDDIAHRSGLGADMLLPILLQLEMSGKVVVVTGGRYQRL